MKKFFILLAAVTIPLYAFAATSKQVSEQEFINNIQTCTPSFYKKEIVFKIGEQEQKHLYTEGITGTKNGKCQISSSSIYSNNKGFGEICELTFRQQLRYHKYRKQSLEAKSNKIKINTSDYDYLYCKSYIYENNRWKRENAYTRLAIPKKISE